MLVTFLILFRESLEAFLLVGILIVYLRRLGGQKYVKWIYVGVVAGLVGSFVAAFILLLFLLLAGRKHRAMCRNAEQCLQCR